MRVRVRFRFNTDTGEVELFQVDDIGTGSGPDHDAEHDRISAELGQVLARRPDVEEISPFDEPPLWRHDPTPQTPAHDRDEETEGPEPGERETT
ncbi:hypothetical protein [Streptomyces justiciae]|uniref:hypothetical protein n=1 Tax=Streptomyces justiciae TaxID=2780140 RepID=UPI00187E37F2|nr:hypothetical protein [Streptomyces justiciae]MBE8470841.1 hypothetical protein [Streptomyces justiciae]MCW8378488.1 hypothetical protein [Streptomyces justiciae]